MTALTMKSIMLTKIVHRTRDCVGTIAGVERIDGLLQVEYQGSGVTGSAYRRAEFTRGFYNYSCH